MSKRETECSKDAPRGCDPIFENVENLRSARRVRVCKFDEIPMTRVDRFDERVHASLKFPCDDDEARGKH